MSYPNGNYVGPGWIIGGGIVILVLVIVAGYCLYRFIRG